jgi:hypothetical protein
LIVSERGSGLNDGSLSLIDWHGNVRPLISGLPSGIEVTGVPSGPTAVVLHGCCTIDLAIGEGDTLDFDLSGAPGSQVPDPTAANSPLFSSVLRLFLSRSVDDLTGGFKLSRDEHETLADGFTVRLTNDAGEIAWVRLLADIKDFRPDPLTNVRGSNPFGMTVGKQPETLLIADGGGNSLVQVGPFEAPKTLLRFGPVANPAGVVPPLTDAVPTAVRRYDGRRYLVTLFAGVPFAEGTSSVRIVDVNNRTESVLLSGLTSVSDVLPLSSGLYVLELSSNVFQGAPGRLLRFASASGTGAPIATGLVGPSGMAYSSRHRAIFIAELFSGQIRRVPL